MCEVQRYWDSASWVYTLNSSLCMRNISIGGNSLSTSQRICMQAFTKPKKRCRLSERIYTNAKKQYLHESNALLPFFHLYARSYRLIRQSAYMRDLICRRVQLQCVDHVRSLIMYEAHSSCRSRWCKYAYQRASVHHLYSPLTAQHQGGRASSECWEILTLTLPETCGNVPWHATIASLYFALLLHWLLHLYSFIYDFQASYMHMNS